ncbi:MAG: helix-turn-helix domain-containing protein [Desulfovibrio sp.]|uniref:helix-turn-helix domain-containing protein n=1 Tax=Desulfovibrio sp. TaxID=885 RepID=UPI00258701A9|nr:helix-turn-helix transcriptional regulator [Desulfovibrio sp.]MCD7983209.1 helix-turn-helix domain-containing protein [Desulfovibrio sp.]
MEEKQILNWALAPVVREAREAADLTQVELADFAGLSKPYISGLERGNINASVFALARIAKVVKVRPNKLMERVEEEIKKGPKKPEPLTGRPKRKKQVK